MKPLLIVNPRSGGGRTGQTLDQLREVIRQKLGDVDVALTERPRHAVEIARTGAEEGRETVVAVGGDGSIHEVVNGLMQAREAGADKTRLGVIGQGTGGDFRKTLGLEHRLDRYCEAIAAGKTRSIDVGRFTHGQEGGGTGTAYFVNILSVGMGGLVDRYVAESGRMLGGTVAYFVASARALMDCPVGRLKCTVRDGGEERVETIRTRSMAICNGRFFGGGMEVAPMADPGDGAFEVVSLGDAPRLRFMMQSSQIYSGKHIQNPDVKHFRCDRIAMELENEDAGDRFLLDVDGEPLGRMPLTIEIVPGALQAIVP